MPGPEKPFVVRRRTNPGSAESDGADITGGAPAEARAGEPGSAGAGEQPGDDQARGPQQRHQGSVEPEQPIAVDATAIDRQAQPADGATEAGPHAPPPQRAQGRQDAQDAALRDDPWETGVPRQTTEQAWGGLSDRPVTPQPPARRGTHVDILAPEPEPAPVRGVYPGDRTFRLRRPRVEGVRRVDSNVYEIVSEPETSNRLVRAWRRLRRTLVGTPIRSEHEAHERLSNKMALAVFG